MNNNNWEYKTLSQLGTVARGKSKHRPRNDAVLFGGKYPFIQTSDIKHANFYVNSYSETYSEYGLKQSKLWNKDTLCMTIAANIAETALLSFPACFPDSIVGFISDKIKSEIKFIKYALDFAKKSFQKSAKGAAQDNLSLEKIDNIKINVPNVQTQSQISSVIFAYDNLIENNEKRIKILEETAQILYTEWFVKYKYPGYEKEKMINSNTSYGKIPEGWKIGKICDVVDIISGYPFKSSAYINDGVYKIVTIKNVQDGFFVPITTDTLPEVPSKVKPEQKLETGDIILSLTGNVGRICLVYGKNYLLNQRVTLFVDFILCGIKLVTLGGAAFFLSCFLALKF